MHVVFTMANNSSAPYFNWFAERCSKQKEVKLTFVCLYPTKPNMIEDVAEYGCECHWVKFDDSKRKRFLLSTTFELYKLFRRLKPDVVHSHLFDDALTSLLAARLARVPIRAITKADAGFHFFYNKKGVPLDKFNNWNATHIVAISEENKNFILKYEKANPAKLHLIHHGIPEDVFTDQSENDRLSLIEKYDLQDCIVAGTVARLIEWKGYRYIIEAAALLIEDYPKLKFLFAGVGDQLEELQQLAKERGVEKHIIFTGWVERGLIPSLYGIMDFYIHAASFEPFGFVIAEAMMNKLPLVSTRTGSALDAIEHEKSGYLVEHGDSKGLADGIRYMLENDSNSIGAKGYEKVSKMYAFERMWQNHVDLYFKFIR
ncbi:glycosyltransferase family 4 protein [Ekhidna sp.]